MRFHPILLHGNQRAFAVSTSAREEHMLLPESNHGRLPFVASLILQSSLVLLLAIPWTVQTLKNNASIQMLNMLNLPLSKPVEPPQTARTQNAPNNSVPTLNQPSRTFRLPTRTLSDPDTVLPAAPELGFDPGPSIASGALGSLSDALARQDPGPAVVVNSRAAAAHDPVVVGGKVQEAMLIHRVQPEYPPLARQARVQGVVTLEAIIGTDGSIQHLRVLGGHPLLIPSAVQAVQQWVYRPTFLNGKAVEVKTTIEVRFTMS